MTISTRPLWRTPALALLALASLAPAARAGPSARGPVRAHSGRRGPPAPGRRAPGGRAPASSTAAASKSSSCSPVGPLRPASSSGSPRVWLFVSGCSSDWNSSLLPALVASRRGCGESQQYLCEAKVLAWCARVEARPVARWALQKAVLSAVADQLHSTVARSIT